MMLRPITFIRGPAVPQMAVGLDLLRAVGEMKTDKYTLDQSNPGYTMMKKMGWEENTPLGIRGQGIIEPIATKGRKNGDTSELKHVVVCAVIVAGKGRHNWRLGRVETLHWF